MISGAAYGVVLNDARQRERLAEAFCAPPYRAPPKAPVLYIKPRNCFRFGGAPVPLPPELAEVEVAATLGLLLARDLAAAEPADVWASVGAMCLAIDVCEPHDSFYRPAVRQRCRDGFLPLGPFTASSPQVGEIITDIDGGEAHRWSLDRLHRPIETLAAEISAFMTLCAGDLLLVGLAGDAPRARAGQTVTVRARGLPSLTTRLEAESEAT
ncbi:MAG TPA: fumarylacetoacetate hydrolase family protein [Caulobacteraceae bacterium]